jgi:uroporphyrinogen-III decarboxylase
MRFTREEYIELMTFGRRDRPMFCELFGPLVGLEEEWAAQGASPGEIDLTAFDWDYVEWIPCGGNARILGEERTEILEETDEYVIRRDALGRRLKLYKTVSTIPLPLDYPVTNMDSWLKVKPLFAFREDRIDRDAVEDARAAQAKGALVICPVQGGFETPRELMGPENACLCYLDQPELMHDIMETIADTAVRVLERVTERIVVDQLSVYEDLAGKAGPLIGPRQAEEFIKPYYRRVWDLLSSRGTRLFSMDTDGNVEPLLDVFVDSGLNALLPLEPAAGMDMVKLRARYGEQLALKGGLDKFALLEGRDAIERELQSKMTPLKDQGGVAFGIDHRIPTGTPLEDYCFYVDRGREILGLPPRSPTSTGWRRMAF